VAQDDDADNTTILKLANELETSCVSIIWDEDDDMPEIVVSGCNKFEAVGQLRWATQRLERELLDDDWDSDGDEDDDDDDEEW
jgi:hypothetical protein